MRDLGLVSFDEPFKRLFTQGMVLNKIYSLTTDIGGKEYFWASDITDGVLNKDVGDYKKGTPIDYEGVGTMSKSKNNGIDPQDMIKNYGADTTRLYTMFAAPPEASLECNEHGLDGSLRFLRRVYNLGLKIHQQTDLQKDNEELDSKVQTILKQINFDYDRLHYNTVVSGIMKILNILEAESFVGNNYQLLLKVLYLIAPHMTSYIWEQLFGGNIVAEIWPEVNDELLSSQKVDVKVLINGKQKGKVVVNKDELEEIVKSEVFKTELVTKNYKKSIYVPNRLINFIST